MLRFLAILLILLAATFAFAAEQDRYPNQEFFSSGTLVIDIRTPGEWQQTGIVEGSRTLMAFDEQGNFDAMRFLSKLDGMVDKGETFAIICRTGRRTSLIADFLDQRDYKVIDLTGGITHMKKIGIPLVPYNP